MLVEWISSSREDHLSLPEQPSASQPDPEWVAILAELEAGAAVKIPFADENERRRMALKLSRWTARLGFEVDIRYGDDYLSAVRSNDPAGAR